MRSLSYEVALFGETDLMRSEGVPVEVAQVA